MLPGMIMDNVADAWPCHSELASQLIHGVFLSAVKMADLHNLLWGKLSTIMTGITTAEAYTKYINGMPNVFALGNPFQVVQAVVCFVTVFVIGLHVLRPWAYESFQNNTMYIVHLLLAVSRKSYGQISPLCRTWLEDATWTRPPSGCNAFHLSRVANLVVTFITDYIAPLLNHRAPFTNANATKITCVVTQQAFGGVIARV